MTSAKRRRAERAAKARAAGLYSDKTGSGMATAWSGVAPLSTPQESLGGRGGQGCQGISGDLLGEDTNLLDSDFGHDDQNHQKHGFSHVRLEDTPDHPDHPDQASVSAASSRPGPLTKPWPSLTTPGPHDIARAVLAYHGYWPLKVSTLCRTMVAQQHPLAVTPVRELVARFDGITPEFEGAVRQAACHAVKLGMIPAKSVDLRVRA